MLILVAVLIVAAFGIALWCVFAIGAGVDADDHVSRDWIATHVHDDGRTGGPSP